MAENKPVTPEQQLLKLIEEQNKGGHPGFAPAAGASAPGGKTKNPFSSLARIPGAILAALPFGRRQAKKKSVLRRWSFGIAEVNRVLTFAAVLLVVYVIFDAAASARNLQRPPNFAPMKDLRAVPGKETAAPLEETSYYLQKVSSRDIFREGKKEEAPREQAATAPAAPETAQAVESLALVGISWSSNPDAIIEDKGKQRTYFVKRGQEVGDGVRVEAIFKDHVVVTYEDREYELR